MTALYDTIGVNYTAKRCTDPRIAKQLHSHLSDARSILNIGAGTGSYEPEDADLLALEPSMSMLRQRPPGAHKAVQAVVEAMPFQDKAFSHSMTVLSLHHWQNREKAYREISRVTRERFIALSWSPTSQRFWFTRDYFPEIYDMDVNTFPGRQEFEAYFDDVRIEPVLIPADCKDGFLAAYWKRPGAYLQQTVQACISSFSKLTDFSAGMARLERDLISGEWHEKNRDILNVHSLDAGYVIVSGKVR